MDPREQFAHSLIAAGLGDQRPIKKDGEYHRFHVQGDSAGSKNGFYVYNDQKIRKSGNFGCWKRGFNTRWRENVSIDIEQLDDIYSEQEITKRRVKQEQKDRKQKAKHSTAANKALNIWNASVEANENHAYLSSKKIKPFDIRQDKSGKTLRIPFRNISGKITTLLFIDENGNKRFLKGGKKKGSFHLIGDLADTIFFAEGYSTAASIHMATGSPVVVVGDCGNYDPVVDEFKSIIKSATFVIAADDDFNQLVEKNPGLEAAMQVAEKYNIFYIIPTHRNHEREKTDFNDVHLENGLDFVQFQLARFL